MSTLHRPGLRVPAFLRLLAVLAMLLACSLPASAAPAAAPNLAKVPESGNGLYIVQMADLPVLSYDGSIAGFRATQPGAGQRPNRAAPDVRRYTDLLVSRHNAALRAVGGQKVYDYTYTFNGFAARLTAAQANKLANTSGVAAVTPDELRQADTDTTPGFLGLTATGGLWDQLGGPARAGNGIIVGVVDSGITPENPSFADNGTYRAPGPRWQGTCTTGEEWTTSNCNGKLIGARYYNAGWGGNAGIDAGKPWEFNSARDYNGHGSHTSSTAAGNNGVKASVYGVELGTISGMAPHAYVAMYKALWSTQDGSTANGYTSDLVAAIEDAIADGVDVINYSISGSASFNDPVEQTFLYASTAGVFVSASAGNSGPGASTVAHNSPWETTVAAGTKDHAFLGTATLGNGASYTGASVISTPTATLPLILSTSAGKAGADPTQVRLCFSGTLDPAVVTGNIVLCDRGSNARVDKSLAVQMAGGLGMILANTAAGQTLNADIHYVPTVHVDNVARTAIMNYIATAGAGATAQLSGYRAVVEAPFVADFSSRGPAQTAGLSLLKPDIMAPGVDVLAAFAPAVAGLDFNIISGTSMAAPHIAGLAALMKERHPDWTPAMIKSALMTTASQVTTQGNPIPGTPFDFGAGQVMVNAAADPGLVYNATLGDYVGFLCGQNVIWRSNQPTACRLRTVAIDDLNVPSVAVGSLAGTETIHRKVTNVGGAAATYSAAVAGLAGLDVQVVPSSLTLNPGETKSFAVTFTRTDAPLNQWAAGSVSWTDGKHNVRMPVVVRPVALAYPTTLTGTGTSGQATASVRFGYTGAFGAVPHGLVPAQTFPIDVATGQVVDTLVTVPAGTILARFSLFDANTSPASDLDLEVYLNGTLVGSSGGGTAQEEVNLNKPVAGTYMVRVIGFATSGQVAHTTLFAWTMPADAAGNMTVTAPATATLGQTANVVVAWSGLTAGTKYLGQVTYHSLAAPANYDDGRLGVTTITVNP